MCDGTGFRGVQQILDAAADRNKSPQPWKKAGAKEAADHKQ